MNGHNVGIMMHAAIHFNLLTSMTTLTYLELSNHKARRHQQLLRHADRALHGKRGSEVHSKHKKALSFDGKNKATMWYSITHAIRQES